MTCRAAKSASKLYAVLLLWGVASVVGFGGGSAVAATRNNLVLSGNLVIDGGGTDTGFTARYTGVEVNPGTETHVIRLSPGHPTLVVRGTGSFGDTCTIGADCYSTDICADRVCGWTGTEVAAGCGDPAALHALDATLDDCVRIWAVANPQNVVSRSNACMLAGSRLWGSGAVVAASCPQLQQYRDGYDLLFSNGVGRGSVLNKAIQQGVPTSLSATMGDTSAETVRIGQMRGVLAVIDAWYRAQRDRRDSAADPELVAATSAVTGMFFKSVFTDEIIGAQAPPASDTDASTIAERIQQSGLKADKQVLRAAFDPEMPLQTAPLLFVTADALQGLSDRTIAFSRVQDIACRFRTCEPGRTSIGNYMKLLGSVADRDGLSAAIVLASTTPRTNEPDTRAAEWVPVFQAMRDQHAVLEHAVLSANEQPGPYSPAMLLEEPLEGIPAYAVPLANIVRPTLTMSNAFENTGTFRPRPRGLGVGMDVERNAKIRARVDQLCSATNGVIPAAVREYQANEREYITNLLQVAQGTSAIEKAERQLLELAARYGDLSSDMAGLRGSRQGEEIAFGSFLKNFEALAPAIADQAQRIEVSNGGHDIDLTASNARFDPSHPVPASLAEIAVLDDHGTPWKVSSEAGDVLSFSISGRWAPTCALRNIHDPDGHSVVVTKSGGGDILTGPEGYSLTVTGSETKALSNSLSEGLEAWTSARVQNSACAGLGWGFIFTAHGEVCSYLEVGTKANVSGARVDSTTGSSMSSFSWNRGVRSNETPFPDEPVGSLLLVELPAGEVAPRYIRSVRVLTYPQSSVIVDATSDYYLVVNDRHCAPVGNDVLGVRLAELKAPGSLSSTLMQAMAAAQGKLREDAGWFVEQGQLLPGQRDTLRASAVNEVYTRSGLTSMAPYAESLRNLFDMFVNREITDIEREIQMIGLERQMRAIVAEEESIELDIASHEDTNRVDSLLAGLALRNLDLTVLESNVGEVSDLLRDWMEPVVNLRINGSLTFTSADKQTLDRVISLSPGGKFVDNLGVACPAVNLLTTKLSDDASANPDPVIRTVILSIPNPESWDPGPNYRPVDAAIAQRAWESMRNGGDLDIAITPAMFYENKEPFSLQCSLSAPVVRSMIYYLVMPPFSPDETFNSENTSIMPDMLFPRGNELYAYTFENPRYLMAPVEILSGQMNTRTYFDGLLGDGGSAWQVPAQQSLPNKGTSPFATYHLDLSRLRATYTDASGALSETYPFRQALSLLVAFQVETISQAPRTVLPGVLPCDPFPPAH